MSHEKRLRPCLLSSSALTLRPGSFAWGQAYPCHGQPAGQQLPARSSRHRTHPRSQLELLGTSNARRQSGACATAGRPAACRWTIAVRHDWRPEVENPTHEPRGRHGDAQSLRRRLRGYQTSRRRTTSSYHLAPSLVGGQRRRCLDLSLPTSTTLGRGADDWTLYLICGPDPVPSPSSATIILANRDPLSRVATFTVTRSGRHDQALDDAAPHSPEPPRPGILPGALARMTHKQSPANQASVQVTRHPDPGSAHRGVRETVIATVDASGLYSSGPGALPSAATRTDI